MDYDDLLESHDSITTDLAYLLGMHTNGVAPTKEFMKLVKIHLAEAAEVKRKYFEQMYWRKSE